MHKHSLRRTWFRVTCFSWIGVVLIIYRFDQILYESGGNTTKRGPNQFLRKDCSKMKPPCAAEFLDAIEATRDIPQALDLLANRQIKENLETTRNETMSDESQNIPWNETNLESIPNVQSLIGWLVSWVQVLPLD
jgi:hypothetical protein